MFAGAPLNPATTPVVLCLHGFPEGAYTWYPMLSTGALDQYTLVAPDQRGYNRSSGAVDSALTVAQLAADIQALIVSDLGGYVHLVLQLPHPPQTRFLPSSTKVLKPSP